MNFSKITITFLLASSFGMYGAAAGVAGEKNELADNFLKACGTLNGAWAEKLLKAGANINFLYPDGTALCRAVECISEINVNIIICSKKNEDLQKKSEAMMQGIKFLIENKADIENIGDNFGRSALQIVCSKPNKDPELIRLLLKSGAKIDHKDILSCQTEYSIAGEEIRRELKERQAARADLHGKD